MTAVLARRLVMAGGAWMVCAMAGITVLDIVMSAGMWRWMALLLWVCTTETIRRATIRVWRWSKVKP